MGVMTVLLGTGPPGDHVNGVGVQRSPEKDPSELLELLVPRFYLRLLGVFLSVSSECLLGVVSVSFFRLCLMLGVLLCLVFLSSPRYQRSTIRHKCFPCPPVHMFILSALSFDSLEKDPPAQCSCQTVIHISSLTTVCFFK